jgi:thymidylate synthase
MQFIVRDRALHLLVNMRSSDAWLGIPYDIFTFTMIQNYVASVLDVDLGQFHMFLGSSHLYIDNFDLAQDVSNEKISPHGRSWDMKSPHLLNQDNYGDPFSFWEAMLISPQQTRRCISSYDDIPEPE